MGCLNWMNGKVKVCKCSWIWKNKFNGLVSLIKVRSKNGIGVCKYWKIGWYMLHEKMIIIIVYNNKIHIIMKWKINGT